MIRRKRRQSARLPSALAAAIKELSRIPGLGPQRARKLHHRLGISTLAELHRAIVKGQVNQNVGFSTHMTERLLKFTRDLTVDPSAQPTAGRPRRA